MGSKQARKQQEARRQAGKHPAGKHKADKHKATRQADTADRHALYQKSVQAPDVEVAFMAETYQALRGKAPIMLREDFCGTALLATEWCREAPDRQALGVDVCAETLDWGRRHNVEPAGEAVAARVNLVQADVREVSTPKADVTCAFNFSYCVFKTRDALRAYFESARSALADDGLLMLDLFGGTESIDTLEEETKIAGERATYVWEHAEFNPINHHILCHIHFEFKDGSRMDKAFTYDWRLWTLPELSELLEEAGFSRVRVYWERFEDAGDDGDYLEGTGEYYETREVENQESWMSYIVAEV